MTTDLASADVRSWRIGVIGVGRMGGAVLRHLTDLGFAVAAYDRDEALASEMRAAGARWCSDLSDLIRWADVVLTVLPDGAVVRDTMTSRILEAARPDTVWVDLTSGAADLTRAFAVRAAAHDVHLVSAPMGGSPLEARHGELQLFVAGPADARTRVRPILDALAREGGIRVVGHDASAAQTVKLLVNALWFASALATSEALLIAQQSGIEPTNMHTLLAGTAGASAFSDRDLPRFLTGDDLATFGIDGIVTELQNLRRASGDLVTPVLDASLRQHEAALDRFGPSLGELLAVRLLEEQNDRALRRQDRTG